MALHSNQRGPGFWKLYTSFLSDIDYANQIRKAIQEVLAKYENNDDVSPALLWEMIKLEVREQSLKYAVDKKAKLNRKEEELEKRINVLQNLIESSHIGEQEKRDASIEQEKQKKELERII